MTAFSRKPAITEAVQLFINKQLRMRY